MTFATPAPTIMKISTLRPQAASKLAEIRRALGKTAILRRIIELRERVKELLRRLRTSTSDRKLSNRAAELKLRAERKAGELLANLRLRGGDHKSTRAARKTRKQTLDRLGISRKHSADWQLEALLPEEDFVSYLRRAAAEGKGPSSHGLQALAKMHVASKEAAGDSPDPFARIASGLRSLAGQGRRFACIYVDPAGSAAGDAWGNGFRLASRLARLPVREVAAPQSHLFLKAGLESWEEAAKVLRAWGFSWKASLARVEGSLDPHALWQPFRDLWLVGVRDGSACDAHGLPPWLEGAGVFSGDSAQDVYAFIEGTSPSPCLDLFGSRPFSKRWTAAANDKNQSTQWEL